MPFRRNPYSLRRFDPKVGSLEHVLPDGRPVEGLTEHQIELLMEEDSTYRWHAPWLYWDSELYSQGLLLRALVRWPTWLPIPVNSDHGTQSLVSFSPRERDAPSGVFVTYNSLKYALAPGSADVDIRLARSPWISWIEACAVRRRPDSVGTLAFLPHSLPSNDLSEAYLASYLEWLDSLGEQQHPVVLCLHSHDIEKGLHRRLMASGRRVVTAGRSTHPEYFLRWLAIAQQFRLGTAPKVGSELLLFSALGGEFLVDGPVPAFEGVQFAELEDYRSRSPIQIDIGNHLFKEFVAAFAAGGSRKRQADVLGVYSSLGRRDSFGSLRRRFVRALPRVPLRYWVGWVAHYIRLIATAPKFRSPSTGTPRRRGA